MKTNLTVINPFHIDSCSSPEKRYCQQPGPIRFLSDRSNKHNYYLHARNFRKPSGFRLKYSKAFCNSSRLFPVRTDAFSILSAYGNYIPIRSTLIKGEKINIPVLTLYAAYHTSDFMVLKLDINCLSTNSKC